MTKKLILALLLAILFYTRFMGLNWGLPYPMHPDERNMASAIQQLTCKRLETRDQRQATTNNLPAGGQGQQLIPNLQSLTTCLNPHFFAYGQLPIYAAHGGIQLIHLILGLQHPITFVEATMALRILSALASIMNVYVLFKIIQFSIRSKIKDQRAKMQVKSKRYFIFDLIPLFLTFAFCLLTFSPYFIQFSHFGTTESLLMLFYSLIIYECAKILESPKQSIKNVLPLAFVSGLAIATKVSSVIFLGLPVIIIGIKAIYFFAHLGVASPLRLSTSRGKAGMKSLTESVVLITVVLVVSFIITILFSPHYIISFKDFVSSFLYESSVASGSLPVFYTRQFTDTIPVLFQLTNIFPYALGWPQYTLALLGFFLLPWRSDKNESAMMKGQVATTQGIPTARRLAGLLGGRALAGNELLTESALFLNLFRLAFLLYFLPTSFLFTKWTRFMTPVFPIMSLFAILFVFKISAVSVQLISKIKDKRRFIFDLIPLFLTFTLLLLTLLPGASYLAIYQQPDVRFRASEWIYQNIPSNSSILSETANVVDIPIPVPGRTSEFSSPAYQYTSFNFYDLDVNPLLRLELNAVLGKSDYIIVPSRRVFANHTCVNPDQRAKDKDQSFVSDFTYDPDRCDKLATNYQLLSTYYDSLFSGSLGYELIQEFSSNPRLSLFGETILEFPDEKAEETWTVFDHPVIRIYKKIPNKSQVPSKPQIPNLKNYKTTNYQLLSTNYRLLIADTPDKWRQGLMFVRSKKDINGLDGMIFIFKDSSMQRFWNKNTFFDLDLYWIQDGKILGQTLLPSIEKSGQTITVSSPAPVNTVIELLHEIE